MPMPRCAMVNAPALDVLPEPRLLHTIRKANGGNLGILAEVVRPGVVRRGDQLRLLG
jgi:MOSC domain-containing protein YiiM